MHNIFAKHDWKLFCGRSDFGASQDANRTLPHSEESHEKFIWVRTQHPKKNITLLHRAPAPTKKPDKGTRSNGAYVMKFCTPPGVRKTITLTFPPPDIGPPVGTMLYPVMEIYGSGKHPAPYGRLPELGQWTIGKWQIAWASGSTGRGHKGLGNRSISSVGNAA
ncbi:hypothetical protein PV08_05279 [Exophiala spinifera]|uniref:Uncharacterized protein n=1 Tax=Exophiala spinifera TaxID=91928 RepID=A0A0D2BVD5_9EURO|nr:uncharacterized protein PV08_05279 [Exophiala spinifera]KIW15234.1 hypothetical protein PV08_05279 [Exophiala spinifera]